LDVKTAVYGENLEFLYFKCFLIHIWSEHMHDVYVAGIKWHKLKSTRHLVTGTYISASHRRRTVFWQRKLAKLLKK